MPANADWIFLFQLNSCVQVIHCIFETQNLQLLQVLNMPFLNMCDVSLLKNNVNNCM